MRDKEINALGKCAPDVIVLILLVLEGSLGIILGVGRAKYPYSLDFHNIMFEIYASLAQLC